jgi:hypothetical protein
MAAYAAAYFGCLSGFQLRLVPAAEASELFGKAFVLERLPRWGKPFRENRLRRVVKAVRRKEAGILGPLNLRTDKPLICSRLLA